MNIPPCPACSGVLRSRGFEDTVRCRCGFEVTGEALLAAESYADPARRTREILAAGRMIPIPQGTPGIRISEDFGSIAKDLWDPRCVGKPDPAVVQAIADTAIRVGAQLGLEYQGEALGSSLITPRGKLERQKLYAMSPLPDVLECAKQMVEVIAMTRGPGDWWSTGGAVGMICDSGQMCLEDIGGVPHVRMRALYFHEPKTAAKITPAGRMEAVLEMQKTGMITNEEARGLLAMPEMPGDEPMVVTPPGLPAIGRVTSFDDHEGVLYLESAAPSLHPGARIRLTPWPGSDPARSMRHGELRVVSVIGCAVTCDRAIRAAIPSAAKLDYVVADPPRGPFDYAVPEYGSLWKAPYACEPPPSDPLLVETDGLQLRELLVIDEVYRREETTARNTLTPAQRQAVSEHWSAQLRLKLAAAAETERRQVVLDTEDD